MNNFRTHTPDNTCDKVYKNYRSYKNPWLINDFKSRCGYCNDHDSWAGGRRGMQIDHFAPKKKFPDEENTYENLVYSCFYCNNHKSDDWVTNSHSQSTCDQNIRGYIHPRDLNYAEAFRRSFSGKIIPLTNVARYMYTQLCLGLKRHELIYILEELFELWEQLNALVINEHIEKNKREILINQKKDIADKFMEYLVQYRTSLKN